MPSRSSNRFTDTAGKSLNSRLFHSRMPGTLSTSMTSSTNSSSLSSSTILIVPSLYDSLFPLWAYRPRGVLSASTDFFGDIPDGADCGFLKMLNWSIYLSPCKLRLRITMFDQLIIKVVTYIHADSHIVPILYTLYNITKYPIDCCVVQVHVGLTYKYKVVLP